MAGPQCRPIGAELFGAWCTTRYAMVPAQKFRWTSVKPNTWFHGSRKVAKTKSRFLHSRRRGLLPSRSPCGRASGACILNAGKRKAVNPAAIDAWLWEKPAQCNVAAQSPSVLTVLTRADAVRTSLFASPHDLPGDNSKFGFIGGGADEQTPAFGRPGSRIPVALRGGCSGEGAAGPYGQSASWCDGSKPPLARIVTSPVSLAWQAQSFLL
jgi:hypothetical protein